MPTSPTPTNTHPRTHLKAERVHHRLLDDSSSHGLAAGAESQIRNSVYSSEDGGTQNDGALGVLERRLAVGARRSTLGSSVVVVLDPGAAACGRVMSPVLAPRKGLVGTKDAAAVCDVCHNGLDVHRGFAGGHGRNLGCLDDANLFLQQTTQPG